LTPLEPSISAHAHKNTPQNGCLTLILFSNFYLGLFY
jgi:hypothetical protein